MRISGAQDESGATAAEYALLIAGIAALIVAVLFLLGGRVNSLFSDSCDQVASGISHASC